MPRNGRCTGLRNPARARSKHAIPVDVAIRRAAADETRIGNSRSNPAAVVRSVSTEAAVRFDRYRKGPFFDHDIANGPFFLQLLSIRIVSDAKLWTRLEAKFSDKFGHGNCVILRESCKARILRERS